MGHVDGELGRVLVAEALRLELDEDMALEDAVVEDEVDPVIAVVDEYLLLARLDS